MVIICIGLFLRMLLLHFRQYLHIIQICSHFSSGLYQILGPFQLSTHFCPDFICMKGYFWIKFDVLRKNFAILRVTEQNINGKCYLNVSVVSLFSLWLIQLGGSVVFILIVCAVHTSLSAFSYIMFYNYFMHYLLSMPLKNHVWVL